MTSRSRAQLWQMQAQSRLPARPPVRGEGVSISDKTRSMGVCLIAGRGSGKSVLVGQVICAQDCVRGMPQIILEGYGPTIDNCLDTLERLPEPYRSEALSRVRYVDMSGRTGHLTAWPLITPDSSQSLYEATRPYAEVVERTDPELHKAPVEGWNAFEAAWTSVGMVLAALGWQISEAELLLNPTPAVVARLVALAQENREVAGAVVHLTETLPSLKPNERERLLSAFKRKIAIFQHDPTLRAMTGATTPTIDWGRVIANGETLMLDFRHVLDSERRRFLMLWVLRSFLHWIKRRGAGRYKPVGLVIDELLALYHLDQQAGQAVFASDLDELLNILARNYRIWVTLAFQEIFQLDWRAQKTLLSMGTKIFGVTSDPEAADTIASILHTFDPALIKAFLPVYDARGILIDAQPLYWTAEEQNLLVAGTLRRLKPFHFLVSRASSEGDGAGSVVPLYVPAKERGAWVRDDVVANLRQELSARTGVARHVLLAQIEERQAALFMTTRNTSRAEDTDDRLGGNEQNSIPTVETPLDIYADFGEPARPQDSQTAQAP